MSSSPVLRHFVVMALYAGAIVVPKIAFASCGDVGRPCELDGTTVYGSYNPGPEPIYESPQPTYDDPYYDNSGTGGGGYEDPQCPILRTSKPSGCTDDVPVPVGSDFGADRFQFGSALDLAIAFTRNHLADAAVAAMARQALANHTAAIAQLTVPASAANDALMRSMADACELESLILDGFPQISPRPWQVERDCANVVGQLVAESGISFLPWFADWIETRTGFTLSDAQKTFVNWLSPVNSLHTKFELTTEDAKCSAWWSEVNARGC